MRYNNYHKHDHVSNIYTPDTNTKAEEYIKKCVEYGHTNYFTTNHGSMGDIFEAKTLCDKYGIRCIAGLEGYIVPDANEKDKSNYHIIIIPKTDKARKKVNLISSRANIEGFYYKPRIFLDDLLELNKDDVYITTACMAGLLRDENSIENIFLPLYEHFKENLLLEVQPHNDQSQIEINRKAVVLGEELGMRLIAANDSHYVDSNGQQERLELLKGKHINYGEEDTFNLDFPDYDTMFSRFLKQGVLNEKQIEDAILNTLIFDECEEIGIDKEIKMPTIYPDLSLRERYELLEKIVYDRFDTIRIEENIEGSELDRYLEGIAYELKTIEDTNDEIRTADYFLFNERNVDLAVNKFGGVLTRGGRGSCGSFYVNRILGMTQLDRFKIKLPIFPDRFASTARLLENRALPDIDYNVKEQEPFVKASKNLLGEHGCYPMIAYGTMQEGEAFRNTCRSKGLPYEAFNDVAKNLDDYRNDAKWKPIIEEANKYVGTIISASVHPCAHVLSNENILSEYGVVRIGENICVMMTSGEADEYKALKNDYLIVTVWKLIDETFKMIGKPIIPASQLLANIKNDQRIWDLFKNGMTCTLNQVDSDNGMQQAKRYEIASFEDGAFIAAAIRPSFDSWREKFLTRVNYSTGSKDLDEVLSMTNHYILFQENLMQYFEWLGVSPAESIGLIKKISKKKIKQEDFDSLEVKLKEKWIINTGSEDMFSETWEMIQSCIAYGFCSAHAAATSLDMCYGAYLKVHHPLEYYTVCLNNYSDDEERTRKLMNEMKFFGIKFKGVRYGYSRASYSCDKQTNTIYKGLSSIKFINETGSEQLYGLSQSHFYSSFVDLLFDIKNETNLNSRQLDILIKIDFFEEFGDINKLLFIRDMFNMFDGRKTFSKKEMIEKQIPEIILKSNSTSETETRVEEINYIDFLHSRGLYDIDSEIADCIKFKYIANPDGSKVKIPNGLSYTKFFKKYNPTKDELYQFASKVVYGRFDGLDVRQIIKDIVLITEIEPCRLDERIRYQLEHLGYIEYINPEMSSRYIAVIDLDDKYSPKFKAYCLKTGDLCEMRVHKRKNPRDKEVVTTFMNEPFQNGDILYMQTCKRKPKQRKDENDNWVDVPNEYNWWLNDYRKISLNS